MKINLIVVGTLKEKYLTTGMNEYIKRLKPFCNLTIQEVKEVTNFSAQKNISLEGEYILKYVNPNDYVITLEIDGNNLSSEEFAKKLSDLTTYSSPRITFIIGGSDGLAANVLNRSNYSLSFGKNTYPHQLMRLIFIEQLYRGIMINNNTKYHK